MKQISLFLLTLTLALSLSAQGFDNIAYDNRTYVPDLASIRLAPAAAPMGYPIITLGSSEQLILNFDDLSSNDNRYLKYTVIHCTHDWKPSDLTPFDYIDGYVEDELTEHSYSFNTVQSYVHFKLLFPNNMLNITKSGNYLLFVYDETPDNPILTRRFMVKETGSCTVSGREHPATDVRYNRTAQEIDFTVNIGNMIIHDPARNLSATIMQNSRWDNAIIGLRHRYSKPGEFSFDYDNNENTFYGSSEFRTFSLKSLRYDGDRIASIRYDGKGYYALVLEDIARPYGAYQGTTTLKGKCYYESSDYPGEEREDYVMTRFSLKCDFPVDQGNIYVFGELTDWQIQDDAKLEFNPTTNYWEAELYLKQGIYNYQYVYVPFGSTDIDATYIEGSHWQTANDYWVFIYFTDETSLYDRLIGTEYINTINGF